MHLSRLPLLRADYATALRRKRFSGAARLRRKNFIHALVAVDKH